MPKKRKDKAEAGVWQDYSMKALDAALKQVLKVPKKELDRREAEYRRHRRPT